MRVKEKVVTGISYLLHPQKRKLIRLAGKFESLSGIEIGGPSAFFSIRSYLPVYLYAKKIDGVNFANSTVWEGAITEGENFSYYPNKKGYQFIREATDLSGIESKKYDFLLSCHCLEHTANPIKALKEWNRVLRPNGDLMLVLPDKNFTFDEFRPVTTIEHLIKDFDLNTGEDDKTHFDEVINLHSLEKDSGVKTKEELIERTLHNYINRCVHHHVFDFELIRQMLVYAGFSVQLQQWVSPFHLVTYAKKVS